MGINCRLENAGIRAGPPVARSPKLARENGFEVLPLRLYHSHEPGALPWHHRDPFDRLLVAQARTERLALVTRDAVFDDYGIRTITA